MKILAQIHAYPPVHNAGAEWMLHAMLLWLQTKGHECRVIIPTKENYEYQGIKVFKMSNENEKEQYAWCDLAISHLQQTARVVSNCHHAKKVHFHIVHNSTPYNEIIRDQNIKVIYNTFWLSKLHKYINESVVVNPPVSITDYKTETSREFITLINLWDDKGGKIFNQIAKLLPEYKFLGVEGGYGDQERDFSLKNMTYINNTPNVVNDVYAKSAIILMPSKYESFGRVAIEAMCSGIPVICHDTPGLREACGDAGIFEDRNNIAGWVDKIKLLMTNENYYKNISEKCSERAEIVSGSIDSQMSNCELLMQLAIEKNNVNKPKIITMNLPENVTVEAVKSFYDTRHYRRGEQWIERKERAENFYKRNLVKLILADEPVKPQGQDGVTVGEIIEVINPEPINPEPVMIEKKNNPAAEKATKKAKEKMTKKVKEKK